jgi:uncharacterized Tic20 family protein
LDFSSPAGLDAAKISQVTFLGKSMGLPRVYASVPILFHQINTMSDPTPGIPPIPDETPYAPQVTQVIPPPPPAGDVSLTENDKTMGMICHLAAFAGVVVPFPFVNIIGPLVVWVTQKDKSPFIDYHGKESLNFQITVAIAVTVAFLSLFLLIGFVLLPAVSIYAVVMTIIAAIKAKEGLRYRFPYSLRLIK